MKRKLLFIFLLSVTASVLSAVSAPGVNIGYGYTYLEYSPESGEKESTLYASNKAIDIELDHDYLFNDYLAFNLRGNATFSKHSIISGEKYTTLTGYGLKAGVNIYLSFLRLGCGVRYSLMRGESPGGERSIRTLFVSTNLDTIITIGEKSSFISGMEYGYPLRGELIEESSGISGKSSLSLDNAFLKTGVIIFYGGYRLKF